MLMLPCLRLAHLWVVFNLSPTCSPKSFQFCENFLVKSYPNPEIFSCYFFSSFPVATMLPKFSRQQVCHDLSFFIICQICDNSNILWTIEWNLISNIMYHNPSTLQPELLNFYAPIVSCDISISQIHDLWSHYLFICCQILPSATLTSLQSNFLKDT